MLNPSLYIEFKYNAVNVQNYDYSLIGCSVGQHILVLSRNIRISSQTHAPRKSARHVSWRILCGRRPNWPSEVCVDTRHSIRPTQSSTPRTPWCSMWGWRGPSSVTTSPSTSGPWGTWPTLPWRPCLRPPSDLWPLEISCGPSVMTQHAAKVFIRLIWLIKCGRDCR